MWTPCSKPSSCGLAAGLLACEYGVRVTLLKRYYNATAGLVYVPSAWRFFHVLMSAVYGMRTTPKAMRVWHVRVHMCAARVACRIRLVKKINRSRNSG